VAGPGEPTDIVRRYFRRLFVDRDVTVCDELLAPEYIDYDAPPDSPRGPGPTRAYVTRMLETYPDLHVDVRDVHATGGEVTLRMTWRGTDRYTGAAWEQSGSVVIRVDHSGQLVERRSTYDPTGGRLSGRGRRRSR
jgi:predicted SnoaL-like aldol condensation-catalyzing enzyme